MLKQSILYAVAGIVPVVVSSLAFGNIGALIVGIIVSLAIGGGYYFFKL
jgi:hypothetical protein